MIKTIIIYIKGLLKIHDPTDIPDCEAEESLLDRSHQTANLNDSAQSVVSFLITKTGNIDLNISWDENDEATAKNLATVLFLINSGAFETNCAELLIKMGQNDFKQMSFVRSIITGWNNRKASEPLIKPSEVFQFGTVGTREE